MEEQTILYLDKEAIFSYEKLIEKSKDFKFLKGIPLDLIQIRIRKYYYCWLDVLKERFKLEDFTKDLSEVMITKAIFTSTANLLSNQYYIKSVKEIYFDIIIDTLK